MHHPKRQPITGGSRRRASASTINVARADDRSSWSTVLPRDQDGWSESLDATSRGDLSGCQFGFLEGGDGSWPESDPGATLGVADLPSTASAPGHRRRPTPGSLRQAELVAAATVHLERRVLGAEDRTEASSYLEQLHHHSPAEADRLSRGMVSLPEPGDDFLGFRIVEELGRGTFGRVFLAHQGELAQRPVALKVTAEVPNESQTLAQLQHTNIVPIFSVHHAATLHAVCMPYFGRATLADLLDDLMGQEDLPSSGLAVAKVIESRQSRRSSGEPGSSASSTPPRGGALASRPSAALSPSPAAALPAPRSEVLQEIGNLSYVNAVLWIVARIAAGLAHAHKRGILHRDLKPANVLMTDEGQPMILDFNLSEDTKGEVDATARTLGGTLRYMSPEHLDGFMRRPAVVDARSDLYALGVMLYELLTGQSPFPIYAGCSLQVLKQMRDDRRGEIPTAQQFNPAITPAIESVIRTCLQADPRRRYASAEQVREDIERHLADLPLRHAADPSVGERARKWLRRHPRLGSTTTAAVVAVCCFLGLGSMLVVRSRKLAQFQAARDFEQFEKELADLKFLFSHRNEPAQQREGLERARSALGHYRVLDDPNWVRRPGVAQLAPEAAKELRSDVAEVLLMMSQVALIQVDQGQAQDARAEVAKSAQRLNEAALLSLPDGVKPQAIEAQRAALARIIDGEAEGARLAAQADKLPLVTARDHYLAAVAKALRGEYGPAVPLAEEATRLDPQYFWAYYVLGVCHENLGADAEATSCFITCTALRPDLADSWFYRGLSRLKRQDYHRARADFDRAARLRPDWSEPVLMRALTSSGLGDHLGANNDLTAALSLGASPTKIHLLRAIERRALGDRAGADEDQSEGLKGEPIDALTWVSRGLARLGTDAAGALADFEAALKIDPRSLPALQDSAYVLANMPGRDEDAIRMLDRGIAAHPECGVLWSSRGVHQAILGRRDEALRDAREALWRDTRPMIQYQVAGIYATTSKTQPEDRAEAYRLLSSALRAGFGFDMIDGDRELDAIRDQPEFREMVKSARSQSAERLPRMLGR